MIGGALFGYFAEWFGIPGTVAAIAGVLMLTGLLVFLFSKKLLDRKYREKEPAGNLLDICWTEEIIISEEMHAFGI